jgi:16S rRNA (cytosine1402-N4)-methyltransferase
MAVNEELESLEDFLRESLTILKPGARLVVITFHSLEDRIVKQFLKMAAASCICPPRAPVCTCQKECEVLIITRKPITASEEELLANTRSRSAKLRAAQKLT